MAMDRPEDTRDRTTAAALQIAHQHLLKLGWAFNASDVGRTAREIVDAFDAIRQHSQKGER